MSQSTQQAGVHTYAEILSQPETWRKCFAALDCSGELRAVNASLPSEGERVFVGCGTSFYLAMVAAATWSLVTGENARAMPASEILLFPELLPKLSRPILISRSGHTSEIIEAGRFLKGRNQPAALVITCGIGTPIEELSPHAIRLPDADEKSTVMTRSFTSMLLALQMLAAERASAGEFAGALRSLADQLESKLADIDAAVRRITASGAFDDYVFLAQGPFYGIAQEAMLKIKEMSCSYAQFFHTLEFRHGPKAIVSPKTLVTFFLSESGYEPEVSVVQEVKELGGATFVITNEATRAVRESADFVIELPLGVPEAGRAAAFVIAAQLLGFHTGIRKGFDPDNPRNLSRVVMLETSTDGDSRRGTV